MGDRRGVIIIFFYLLHVLSKGTAPGPFLKALKNELNLCVVFIRVEIIGNGPTETPVQFSNMSGRSCLQVAIASSVQRERATLFEK